MRDVPETDVIVVGAGPVGLMMAHELVRYRVGVRIVDMAPGPTGHCRAVAVQMRSMELLARAGLLGAALDAGLIVRAANLYRGGTRVHRFEIDPSPRPGVPYPFVLSLEQSESERVFTEALNRLGVAVEWGVELVALEQHEDGVSALVQLPDNRRDEIRARYAVGCDGTHSAVRRALGIEFEGSSDPRTYLLADVEVRGPLEPHEIHRFMQGDDVLVVWPLRGNRRFFITGPLGNDAIATAAPTLDDIQTLCVERVPAAVTLIHPRWLSRYRVQRRLASRFRDGRAFLAGDAAHAHPTTGGQGMNTGVQDACNLAWKLAAVIGGVGRAELLDSYEAERRPVAKHVLELTDTAFRWEGGPSHDVRHRLVGAFSQLDVGYRASPIVDGGPAGGPAVEGVAPGDRAPDGSVSTPSGQHTTLFASMDATRHSLVVFSGPDETVSRDDSLTQLAAEVRRDWSDVVDVCWIHSMPPATEPAVGTSDCWHLLDDGGTVHRTYGANSPSWWLVRPDGYVAAAASSSHGPTSYLERIFLPRGRP